MPSNAQKQGTCQGVSAYVATKFLKEQFYFSSTHVFRKKSKVQVNLEPLAYV